jgi:ATP-dependent RNA helicase HelY
MFDAETAALIRRAPAIRGVDPAILPQDLTRAYAELVALRLRQGDPGADTARELQHDRLLRIAAVYEALVDTARDLGDRRGSAFVAGTAYQILGRVGIMEEVPAIDLLTPAAIHPDIAAPLLFLIAGQNPDAREAGRRLAGARTNTVLTSAMMETVADLATENFEEILARAERLGEFRPTAAAGFSDQATQALYGLCWTGVVQMVGAILDRPVPATLFRLFDTPEEAFRQVEELAIEDLAMPDVGAQLVSAYAGPRHLARLLRHVAGRLAGTGLATLPAPAGAHEPTWRQWSRYRARSKPILWPNHIPAIHEGILALGTSAVLVLPTGAGKTTLSELKIAATVSAGKKVVFLVPTLALVDQLRDDLAASFPPNIGGIVVSADGDLAVLAQGPELSAIEVMTPERFLALLGFTDADLSEVGLIVFDECHLLSPEGGRNARSVDAMLSVLHAARRIPDADFLFLSAMLTNGGELAGWLGALTGRNTVFFEDRWKPSRQARGLVIYPDQELTPVSEFIRRRRRQPNLKPPPFRVTAHALFGLQQNWVQHAPTDTKIVRLLEEQVEINAGTQGPTPNSNTVAVSLAGRAAEIGLKTIVFVQQAGYAPSTAQKLAGRLRGADRLTEIEQAYVYDITIELGQIDRSLVTPGAGAVPHNGDMLPLERRLAESLFRRPDGINVIVATPTLAQGINLPAQLAVLAGNKRVDERGREDLEAHEILNAAGRAGYLANGVVLLIPEPVLKFNALGPTETGFLKLRSILPDNDQCVWIDDPLQVLLDQIEIGLRGSKVRYLVSRLRAGEEADNANAAAMSMVRRSFAAYRAAQAGEMARFDAKAAALEGALAEEVADGVTEVTRISAFSGLASSALSAMSDRLADLGTYPTTIGAWLDWIIDFLRDDANSRNALFDDDASIITAIVRGKKTGGDLTEEEFQLLRSGLRAWIAGQPFQDIELALGVPGRKVGRCPRSRDLVLKLVNRRLYMISAAVAELAKAKFVDAGIENPFPALLECLAYAVRLGFDTPEKVALAHLRPQVRTRVGVHRACANLGPFPPAPTASFRDVLQHVRAALAFDAL